MNSPDKLHPLTLVLGGQRSGKSAYGESLLAGGGIYLATANAEDAEMLARIERHRAGRGAGWQTVEEPLELLAALANCNPATPVLVDSIGLWVANMLAAGREIDFEKTATALCRHPAPVVVVSEETGLGLVPMAAVARNFVDALGLLNQSIARQAQMVVMLHAGIPNVIKNRAP